MQLSSWLHSRGVLYNVFLNYWVREGETTVQDWNYVCRDMSTTPKLIVPWFIFWILFSMYNCIWYLESTTLSILEILFRQKCIFILKTSFFTHNNLLAKKEPWRKRVAPTFRIPSSKAMPLQFSCIKKLNDVCDIKFMLSALN